MGLNKGSIRFYDALQRLGFRSLACVWIRLRLVVYKSRFGGFLALRSEVGFAAFGLQFGLR